MRVLDQSGFSFAQFPLRGPDVVRESGSSQRGVTAQHLEKGMNAVMGREKQTAYDIAVKLDAQGFCVLPMGNL